MTAHETTTGADAPVAAVGTLLGGIAAVAWPLLAIVLVLTLRRQIRNIADSVGRRGGSVKLAGFEVTIAEATEQQQKLIADLQLQLGHVQDRLDRSGTATTAGDAPPDALPDAAAVSPLDTSADTAGAIPGLGSGFDPTALIGRRLPVAGRELLWVDGHPAASAAFLAALQDWGFRLVTVETIEAALTFVAAHPAALIVSRMSLHGEPGAGVALVEQVLRADPLATIAILAPAAAIARRGAEALAAGAAFVTASPAELIRFLSRLSDD
ncbi:MAG: hypothetical protein JO290_02290 [Sphingomonadaceae bacterium]|nr:hypothetical protein [Sphingomonadaceae bacterium]